MTYDQIIAKQMMEPFMPKRFVKNCFLKLVGRRLLVPHKENRIIGIHPVDGIFCLLADRRVYDDLGQVVEVIYDAETNTCQPTVKAAQYPPKDLIHYHLTDGSTRTVCPSLGIDASARRLP
jgi:hypothetical protein